MKTLAIDACVRAEDSRTKKLLDEALRLEDDVTVRHLSEMGLLPFDRKSLAERDALLAEGKRDAERFDLAHEFANADRIIVAAPFWDLSFPSILKVYIEHISVEGITFGVVPNGTLKGLARAKDLVYLTTRGGNYADSPLELGVYSMRAMAEFYGIERFHAVTVDGLDLGGDVEEKLDAAKKEIRDLWQTLEA